MCCERSRSTGGFTRKMNIFGKLESEFERMKHVNLKSGEVNIRNKRGRSLGEVNQGLTGHGRHHRDWR